MLNFFTSAVKVGS